MRILSDNDTHWRKVGKIINALSPHRVGGIIRIGANLRLPNRVRGTVYVVAHGVLWSMFALKGANRPD